jgi:heme oxygenase
MSSLRVGCIDLHTKIEALPFNQRMIAGCITKPEYYLYLMMQRTIFRTMEEISNYKDILPFESAYRFDRITYDIGELGCLVNTKVIGRALRKYCKTIAIAALEEDINKMRAHVYLNYMGLAFGGSMIKSRVPGVGSMYEFDDKTALINHIRKFEEDPNDVAEMLPEVRKGFKEQIAIFKEIQYALDVASEMNNVPRV